MTKNKRKIMIDLFQFCIICILIIEQYKHNDYNYIPLIYHNVPSNFFVKMRRKFICACATKKIFFIEI